MSGDINDKNKVITYQYLNRLIDSELKKNSPDMELIDECNVFLDCIEQGIYEPQSDIKSKELQKLFEAYRINHPKARVTNYNFKWSKLATAACVIIMFMVIPITVAAINGCTPLDLIEKIGITLFSWKAEEKIEYEGMTFIRNGNVTVYDNAQECIEIEDLNIYYTSWLPECTYIESVVQTESSDETKLYFEFNNDTIIFNISINSQQSPEYYANSDFKTIVLEDMIAYYTINNDTCWATTFINKNQYFITSSDYETTVNILKGLTQ